MAALPDHYGALRLPRAASDREIRTAYRRLALVTHPDKPGGSEESFHVVAAAFVVLSSPNDRVAYDAALAEQEAIVARQKQPKVAVSVDSAREKALSRLEAAVASIPKEKRRAVLETLPGTVSEALLAWMQTRRSLPGETSNQTYDVVRDKRPASKGAVAFCAAPLHSGDDDCDEKESSQGEDKEGAVALCGTSSSQPVGSESTALAVQPVDKGNAGKLCADKAPGRSMYGQGIKKAGGGSPKYQVSVFCLNMHIIAKYVDTLETALSFHTALVLIKNVTPAFRTSYCLP